MRIFIYKMGCPGRQNSSDLFSLNRERERERVFRFLLCTSAFTAYGKGVRLCLCVFMCVHLVCACAYNAIASGRWSCGTRQLKRADGEVESYHPHSSLSTETRRESNQPHTCWESLSSHLLSPRPHLLLFFLKIRCHTHSFVHILLVYLASQEAHQVITGMLIQQ